MPTIGTPKKLSLKLAAFVVASLVAFSLSSAAQAQTPQALTTQALGKVEHQAAALPDAQTPQTAAQQQAALQPAVDAAVARGPNTARQLLHTTATTSPAVAADLLRHATPMRVTRTKRATPGGATASSYCWGSRYNQYIWQIAGGANVAWIYVRANGWCGNGSSITWYGGGTFANWSWGPYCITNYNTNYSWDVPWSWIHMGTWGSVGVSYPWGCFGLKSNRVTLRIAANGYWDYYNDFGI